jgi:hypothetical protein
VFQPPLLGFRGPGRANVLASGGGGGEVDPGIPEQPTVITTATGDTTIKGKVKPGSFGKFVLPLATIAADRQYTFRYTPKFAQLAQQGKLAMVGFGMKSGNDFHLVGLRGDGTTGLRKYQVNGTNPNGWNKETGHTTNDGGAAAAGTQAGPNYIRLITSTDGATYKFQSSTDGVTYSDNFTGQTPTPFSNVSGVVTFGLALWFNNADAGPFEILIEQFANVAAPASDPLLANVVLLWECEGTDGQTSSLVDATGKTITASGTGHLEVDQKRFGNTSYFVGTGGFSLADSADWVFSTANSSPFTFEYSVRQGTLETWEIIQQFGSSPNKSFWIRHQDDGNIRFLASSDGSTSFTMDVTTTGFGITTNAWHDICIQKDSSGVLSFWRNGVFKYSTTPANSVFANAAQALAFNAKGAGDAYVDHIRLTKASRYTAGSNYTFVEATWPTA